MMPDFRRHHRPPWRHSDEPWPPRRGQFVVIRRTRARFFRRLAFAALALLLLTAASVFTAAWLLADRLAPAGRSLAVPLVLMLIAAAVASFMVGAMRKFASPLRLVMDAADRVAEGDYSVRVPEYGPLPMRALARSFNTMAERLENADRLRRNVMADVAHELRTPLSVLQGRLEGLIDGLYPRDDRQLTELLEETHVLSRLIEDLRTLALSDAGALPLQKEPTDLVGLVRDVVGSMASEADRKSVSLSTRSSTGTGMVDLDPLRIREVLTNVLSNALQHSKSAGAVTVSVAETSDGVTVSVRDDGEGMPPEDVARMFDRFYKGPGSRGSGLGLAIAKSIVTTHGGDIRAVSEVGKGTTLEFTLPRSVAGG